MKLAAALCLSVVLLAGCGRGSDDAPIRLAGPVEFVVDQRSTVAVPGSDGRVLITLDDITAGQVITSLAWQDGRPIFAPRSMGVGDVATFTAGGHAYEIRLERLVNLLVGTDMAAFVVRPAGSGDEMAESDKIDRLITKLGGLQGAVFVRNGRDYDAQKAVAHLTTKWNAVRDEVMTAEDFIGLVGSRSSTTGKPYKIRFADGTETETGPWLREQLKKIEGAPQAPLRTERVDRPRD